ncbi:MOSC domain-containing protein [Sediminivirga luteola]|uniref:MOSC domain-containing protein n=1 Tax=Sediminivirga luteola TaxID=1774748 RepID=UPI001F5A4AB0|nr:MOSC N-terminal beta barrel domain-containing protein [Sediminivirga luteola]MCI2265216.1 MOSC domain-containing protein [Sediminivirga luteola]
MVATLEVVAAGLSPMKGTRHLSWPQLALEQDGPAGDREFCLVDAEAGTVLRTVQHPALLAAVVRRSGRRLEAEIPGEPAISAVPEPAGGTIEAEYWGRAVALELIDGPFGAAFSRYLERPVQLARAPRGGVVYGDQVTLVGTASLHAVAATSGRREAGDWRRYRPTFVVRTEEPFEEERWAGHEVKLGNAVVQLGEPVPRCAVIDVDPQTGSRGRGLLATLSAMPGRRGPLFGVYASVIESGTVRPAPGWDETFELGPQSLPDGLTHRVENRAAGRRLSPRPSPDPLG